MSQTAYTVDQSSLLPGQLADAVSIECVSAINSTQVVPFGKLVVAGASEGLGVLPAVALGAEITNKGLVLGVSVKSHAMEVTTQTVPSYLQSSVMSLLRKGRIAVKVEEAVAVGDPVVVRFAAGGDGIGSFAKTAGAAHAALGGAAWVKGAAIGGLAVLEVNLVA